MTLLMTSIPLIVLNIAEKLLAGR